MKYADGHVLNAEALFVFIKGISIVAELHWPLFNKRRTNCGTPDELKEIHRAFKNSLPVVDVFFIVARRVAGFGGGGLRH